MNVLRPHEQDPSAEELQELACLRSRIEQATADGRFTMEEFSVLQHTSFARGVPSTDQLYRTLELYRLLVGEKTRSGELFSEVPGL